ncbi:hypothetical protein BY996DRAFT_6412079 [Phakopsora pachyrhizi]|nr:hypothetical protein BY996DRAFT_6412079 [Phakopsora pachyrhizi]
MARPTETTRMEGNRTAESVEVGRKPGDRIGIAGGAATGIDRPEAGTKGLEVALEWQQVIGRRKTETKGALEGPSKRTTTKGIEQGHGVFSKGPAGRHTDNGPY